MPNSWTETLISPIFTTSTPPLPYMVGKLWISPSIWHQAIEIWRILPPARILRTRWNRNVSLIWELVISGLRIFVPSYVCTSYICHFLYLVFLFLVFLFLRFLHLSFPISGLPIFCFPIFVPSYICHFLYLGFYVWCFLCLFFLCLRFLYMLIPRTSPSCEMGWHHGNNLLEWEYIWPLMWLVTLW